MKNMELSKSKNFQGTMEPLQEDPRENDVSMSREYNRKPLYWSQ